MAKIDDKRPLLERFRSLFQGAARQTRPFVPALSLELLLLELIWEIKPPSLPYQPPIAVSYMQPMPPDDSCQYGPLN